MYPESIIEYASLAAGTIKDLNKRRDFLKELGYVQTNVPGSTFKVTGSAYGPAQIALRQSGHVITPTQEQNLGELFPNFSYETPRDPKYFNPDKFFDYYRQRFGGETPREETARRTKEAEEARQRPYKELEAAEAELAAYMKQYEEQVAEQGRVQAQAQKDLAAAQEQAALAKKRGGVSSAYVRQQAELTATKEAQAASVALKAQQKAKEKPTGATVGQPRRSVTRVSSPLRIGGYGGSAPARVSPTGLNI